MTITWETNVVEVVWESQTAPGITWTTVVGGTGGETVPARRLLPNTVGTPGQIPAVNQAGTAVEYVDAPAGGDGVVQDFHAQISIGGDAPLVDAFYELASPGTRVWLGERTTASTRGLYVADGSDTLVRDPEWLLPLSTSAVLHYPQYFASLEDLLEGSGGADDHKGKSWSLPVGFDPRTTALNTDAHGIRVAASNVDGAIGGDSYWSANGSGGITPADNVSLATQKVYFNSEADPNHSIGASGTLNGPEIRGYAEVGVYVGDTENDAATLVGRFHADGLEVDHGDGPAEVIAQGDGAGGGLSGTFPNPGLNASSVQSLVLAYLAAGANISLAVNGGGDLVISVTGLVADAISDGTTTVAPSQNAVFDALAMKVPTSRTIAGLDLSADRTAAALKTALSLVKADVGLGSVDNTADSAKTLAASQITSGTMAQARLGTGSGGAGALFLADDQTYKTPPSSGTKVLSASRWSGSGAQMGTSLAPMVAASVSAQAYSPGHHVLAKATHSGQTLSVLSVQVTASSLSAGQTIEVQCYAEATDGGPGARLWTQSFTIGASTGIFTATGLSKVMPSGGCYIGVLNPSGNAGAVTLRAITTLVNMSIAGGAAVLNLVGQSASNPDLSSTKISLTSSSTVIGVDTFNAFPVVLGLA